MEIEMTDVHVSQQNTSCVLQHNKCRKHQGNCPNPWILNLQVHDFLHRLPGELQRTVITEAVVPQPKCIKHLFGHCHNPWECRAGAHTEESPTLFDSDMAPCTPSTCYTSRCQLIHSEGYRAFFQHNVFVFKSRHCTLRRPSFHTNSENVRGWFRSLDHMSNLERDYRATRLLDFIDAPECKGQGSLEFQIKISQFDEGSYDHDCVDKYRYTIRHLVFTLDSEERPVSSLAFRHTWAWALTVDWNTLPNLETLVLDLRGYSYRQLQDLELPQELYDEQLERGAKRMECLELKSLIIYGLCSGPEYWDKIQHRRAMEALFQPALGKWGKLELRDEEYLVDW
jgi:hypothetical protein